MNNTIKSCPLCSNDVPATDWDDNRVFHVECKVCGTYRISDGAVEELSDSGPHPDLSGVVRLRSEARPPQLITRDNYKDLKSSVPAPNDVPAKLPRCGKIIAAKATRSGLQQQSGGCP